ncbi:sensor histidine kinase [Actinoplanes sp. GCM10030250]|uniref:sensor histidine kinase n=1 Tax=Actinoplanes sp. GCM10030250 TaxID=3273376 RepID=UPI00360A9AB7
MREVLGAVWGEPRPFPRPPGRVWRDWVLVAVLIPVAVAEGLTTGEVAGAVVAVALVPALLWRRTRPLLMVAIAFGACAVFHPEMNVFVFLSLLTYALFRWGSGPEMVAGAAIFVGKLVLSLTLDQISAGELIAGLVFLFGTGALGIAMRYRARLRLRELEKVQLLERERIARDLHDTVAHHVSAMAIRAQAGLATAPADPESAVAALRVIESEASQALTEMRAMVRMLRDGPRDVAALAGSSPAGPPVDVQVTGDLDDLPPDVADALYRLTQESVTNARRHARHATRITVRVSADETAVRLQVSDDGEPATQGYGLTGMSERAGLVGGTCSAGPDPDRGWTVDAVLPRTAA